MNNLQKAAQKEASWTLAGLNMIFRVVMQTAGFVRPIKSSPLNKQRRLLHRRRNRAWLWSETEMYFPYEGRKIKPQRRKVSELVIQAGKPPVAAEPQVFHLMSFAWGYGDGSQALGRIMWNYFRKLQKPSWRSCGPRLKGLVVPSQWMVVALVVECVFFS